MADSSSSSVPHKKSEVNVYVGPENELFVVPRMLLYTYSRYFEQQLKKPEPRFYLWSDEPPTFKLMLKWMHNGRRSLDLLEQEILSNVNDEEWLGDGCHLLCDLYCMFTQLDVMKDGVDIIDKIFKILRHGHSLPLQSRTIRTVLRKLPEGSILLDHLLKELADDLLAEDGHEYDYYAELWEGLDAVPGLVKALFIRLKEPKSRGPQHRRAT